jgi:asparagine synthase (glutamine-hydrolysing)
MCDSIVHRGPDDRGYFWDEVVALGHCRLSIIDVAGGKQPLGNEDESVQVTYNGEIYNYRELRDELKKSGHRFCTNTDTEILVHLYEEVGERLPEYLNGMFAFALWDARNRRLLLARDRFGQKPLYYSRAVPGFRFCFASELKAFYTLPGFSPAVAPRSVATFLSLGYIPDPDTICNDVFKLRPGHSLVVTPGTERSRQYWKPSFEFGDPPAFGSAVEELRALAQDAVQRRMISDVPLGAFLSGGVDSSSIVALMVRNSTEQVKTFSIGFTDQRYDERHYAQMIARRYQTDHYERIVSPSVYDTLGTLVEQYDEPFGDSSAVATLYLSKLTREHVTVGLSGDGADEVFGGYQRYFWESTKAGIRRVVPPRLRSVLRRLTQHEYPNLESLPKLARAKETVNRIAHELGDSYFSTIAAFRDGELERVLSPELLRSLDGFSPRERFRQRFQRFSSLPALQQLQAVDFETYLPGDILVKVDRATMAHSLEARSPWLDYRLAELACRLPPSYKLRGRTGKYILKQAMYQELPDAVISRRKMGFSVPLALWFRTSLRPLFEATALSDEMSEYVSLDYVHRLWSEQLRDTGRHETKLWYLLMLALWDRRYRRSELLDLAEFQSRAH